MSADLTMNLPREAPCADASGYGVRASAGQARAASRRFDRGLRLRKFARLNRLKPALHNRQLRSGAFHTVVSAALLLGSTAICSAEGWSMFRGSPGLVGIAEGTLATKLEKLWEFKTADAIKSSTAIVSNHVFI